MVVLHAYDNALESNLKPSIILSLDALLYLEVAWLMCADGSVQLRIEGYAWWVLYVGFVLLALLC